MVDGDWWMVISGWWLVNGDRERYFEKNTDLFQKLFYMNLKDEENKEKTPTMGSGRHMSHVGLEPTTR